MVVPNRVVLRKVCFGWGRSTCDAMGLFVTLRPTDVFSSPILGEDSEPVLREWHKHGSQNGGSLHTRCTSRL